ncbi:MAG: N-acetyltransferase family protein [Gemmatimonadota bacterium]
MNVVVTIRRATVADAAVLAAFGARSFADTFGAFHTPADLAMHLAEAFGVAQQTAELEDPATVTLFAEIDGALAGFTQVYAGAVPECVTGPAPIEIKRFYVDTPWHGQGVAQRLIDAAYALGRERRAQTVWLGVWEHNPRAIAFYRRQGFTQVGAHTFMVGTDATTDLLFARPL